MKTIASEWAEFSSYVDADRAEGDVGPSPQGYFYAGALAALDLVSEDPRSLHRLCEELSRIFCAELGTPQ